MKGFFSVVFIILCVFFSSVSCVDYFVSPFVSCGTTCRGTGTQPFDNLLVALNTASTQTTQSTIYLLSDVEAPHYVLTDQAGDISYTVPSTNFQLRNIVIRPLFCDDAAIGTFPALASNCTESGERVTVYFKTTNFTISILNSLQVENVIFDGIEDIQVWNPTNTRVQECLENRQRCCDQVSLTSSLISSLFCAKTGDYSSLNLTPRQGVFVLSEAGGSTQIRTLSFSNVAIQNFVSPQAISLIQTGANNFKLTFTKVTVDNVYFGSGLIAHSEDQEATNSSTISLSDITFSNYNYWNLYSQDGTRGEGYFFYGSSSFSGLFQITDSTFTNISVSTRSTCWAPLQVYYQRPSSNSLATYPRSRTDLWNAYHSDHRQIGNMSSLIYMKSIYGAVSIQDSDFTNIIGTSGSVLRVDDTINSDNWFTIYNNVFDNNFAFDGFANIRIVKQSDGAFANMLKCPNIEISNSKFTNSYGCPGAYGNVFLLCYWDTQPPTNSLSLSNYNLPDNYTDVGTFLDEATNAPHISVTNSVFQGNRLSVSNSLAIIGSQQTNLIGNTIQNNGGTSSGLYLNAIQNSYFATRYASKINSMGLQITNHFGQSSSVYFDHAIRLNSKRNTYKNNFGPFEGSTALGAALSIRNQIELAGALVFISDMYSGHQGIPTDMAQNLQTTLFKNNLVSPPMIALHFDKTASQAVLPAGRRSGFTTLMNGVIFFNSLSAKRINIDTPINLFSPSRLQRMKPPNR